MAAAGGNAGAAASSGPDLQTIQTEVRNSRFRFSLFHRVWIWIWVTKIQNIRAFLLIICL